MRQGQWFPGNMAKAIKHLRHDLQIIDLVIELLDARIPYSSRNPALAGMISGKKHLVLLHKADRADPALTEKWLLHFNSDEQPAFAFSVQQKHYLQQLMRYLKTEEDNLRSGRIKRPLRMIFVGIPNVGKSTLINHFVHKSVVKTGNQPGVTKGRQWVRITPGLELLDTPGVLGPRNSQKVILPLAVVGAIPPSVVEPTDAALWLISYYLDHEHQEILNKRYRLDNLATAEVVLDQVGAQKGCLLVAGKVDRSRAAAIVIRDFQNGLLGKVTLEAPGLDQNIEDIT